MVYIPVDMPEDGRETVFVADWHHNFRQWQQFLILPAYKAGTCPTGPQEHVSERICGAISMLGRVTSVYKYGPGTIWSKRPLLIPASKIEWFRLHVNKALGVKEIWLQLLLRMWLRNISSSSSEWLTATILVMAGKECDLVKLEPDVHARVDGRLHAEDVVFEPKNMADASPIVGLKITERKRRLTRSSVPSTHHRLPVTCVHTSCVDTCNCTKQVISGVQGVRVHMGVHLVHNDWSANSKNGISIRVVEGVALIIALQNANCIICISAKRGLNIRVLFL